MTSEENSQRSSRLRREPPPFRRVALQAVEELTPRMQRVVLSGPELEGFEIDSPAASVRLLLPPRDSRTIEMPAWTGNQFELADGQRAPIRTFTPRHFDHDELALTLDIVVHEHGAASDWVKAAEPGDEVAISGPGRGYDISHSASSYLLVGDETAIPAISQLLEALSRETKVKVEIEVADPAARLELPSHPNAAVRWHEANPSAEPGNAMATAVEELGELAELVWVAGEAAAVQRIRKHLFEVRGLPRSAVTARGYWKKGRSAT